MYIIQTNESINNDGKAMDFQSRTYHSKFKTFEEFKDNLLNAEGEGIEHISSGTMPGLIKPKDAKIINISINDDFHIEITFERKSYQGVKHVTRSKYYAVKCKDRFNINPTQKYRIKYIDIESAKHRIRLEDCKIGILEGTIENFCPGREVVINTDKGLQIINYRQIVEMITI